MKPRAFLIFLLIVLGAALLGASLFLPKMAKVPAGYKAKVTCSEVFLAGRSTEEVMNTNFANISPTFDWVKLSVDTNNKTVNSSFLGLGKTVAIYRDGIGCSLAGKNGVSSMPPAKRSVKPDQPYTVMLRPDVQKTVETLFDDSALPNPIITRGVVVIQKGRIIAEQYADGFSSQTRQQSWSTAKGVTQALIGIAIKQNHLALDDRDLLPDWQGDDPRSNIMIGHLLHMASGLEFGEAYENPNSHVDQMLFNQESMGAYAAERKLQNEPGTVSTYSSGTTNILSLILRQRLEAAGVNYHAFPYQELFEKLGMSSAIFEVDAAGHFIGSSYIYATPRDFAKFGQLYLQDGVWNEEQILPKGWVDYTKEPAPGSEGKYGSHWSLNIGGKVLPGLPEDVVHLGGNDGQMIVVIPSKDAVIVRMGVTRYPANLEDDVYPLIRSIYEIL